MSAAILDHAPSLDSALPPEPKALGWDIAADRTAAREVLSFQARYLMELPSPPRLAVHAPGVVGIVRFGGAAGPTGDEAGVRFEPEEWAALVEAVEADRLWPRDFAEICELKQREVGWALTRARALAGGQPDRGESWTVAEVLDRLGVRLLSVGFDD
jgi:hypothetical protein